MNNMSEDEIKNIKEILELSKEEIESNNENITATLDFEDLKSLRVLYDLHRKEKEKNKELEEELSISIHLLGKTNSYLENISRKLKLTDENTYGYIYHEIIDKLEELLEE